MPTPSNPAQLTADEKFDGPFYAYVIASMGGSSTSDPPTTFICLFMNVDVCKEWWELILKNVKAAKFNNTSYACYIKEEHLKKQSMQWYSFNSTNVVDSMRDIEKHAEMASVKGKWSYKYMRSDVAGGFPMMPFFQNDNGWPRRNEFQYNVPAVLPGQQPSSASSDSTNAAILTALERINNTLESMQGNMQTMSLANSASSGGEGWVDGASGPGGQASYQVVENAFRKAKELKDRGDNRSFGMIFAQLSMELRRKV